MLKSDHVTRAAKPPNLPVFQFETQRGFEKRVEVPFTFCMHVCFEDSTVHAFITKTETPPLFLVCFEDSSGCGDGNVLNRRAITIAVTVCTLRGNSHIDLIYCVGRRILVV